MLDVRHFRFAPATARNDAAPCYAAVSRIGTRSGSNGPRLGSSPEDE